MFNIYVVYKCRPGKGEEFLKRIAGDKLHDAVRAEDGCIKYDYYPKYENPDEILLIETWESAEHQKVHMTQPHMARFREIKDECVLEVILGKFETSSL